MTITEIIGLLLYGGSLFLLGALVALWLAFGPNLWWDESEHELTTDVLVEIDGEAYAVDAEGTVAKVGS